MPLAVLSAVNETTTVTDPLMGVKWRRILVGLRKKERKGGDILRMYKTRGLIIAVSRPRFFTAAV